MSNAERRRLTEQQAQLLEALSTPGRTLPGFDARLFRQTARSLLSKRARAAARVWPRLRRALADTFDELFADYAEQEVLPADASPLSDGRAFVRWLQARQSLPDDAVLEVLAVDLRYRHSGKKLHPRWCPSYQWLRLPQSGRLVIALRWPGIGEWWRG